MILRHALRLAAELTLAGWRSGRLWFPVVAIALAVAASAAAAVKVVVPTVTYVLF